MRDRLSSHLQCSFSLTAAESQGEKRAIIDHVLTNCDVQFHWCMLSVDGRREREREREGEIKMAWSY